MVEKKKDNIIVRPPVVVVLGHVDHGKSSLIEKIKDLKITAKESGGITQHIGAYEVEHEGKKITIIDTPGHEAFSAMRSRGAKIADIAILVIAAEEGIKPQTKEAIVHIKKAQIPMIVALNKIDKPEADPEKVKRELADQEVLVESMGGKVLSVEVSAISGKGISDLLDLILLVAEMENLKGDPTKPARGVVIESYLDPQRGPTCTLLLQEGMLRTGDIIGAKYAVGKIKSLEDFQGNPLQEALPSWPIIIVGFEQVPGVGEQFQSFATIEEAKKNVSDFPKPTPEVLVAKPDAKVLNLILKVDVIGSLEAIQEVLRGLPQEKVHLRILKAEVGEIGESDVQLARSGKAKIIGFRIKTNPIAQDAARRDSITIITFEVIYELVQAVRQFLEKQLAPEIVKVELGKVKILALFHREKNRQTIGGKVTAGYIKKGASVEVYRAEELVGKGKIVNLQRDKKEVPEAAKRSECGILFEGNVTIEEGDIFAAYTEERRKGEL